MVDLASDHENALVNEERGPAVSEKSKRARTCTNDPDTPNARLPSRTLREPGMSTFSCDFAGRRP